MTSTPGSSAHPNPSLPKPPVWPNQVPGLAQAQAILGGSSSGVLWASVTRRVLSQLSELELEAVRAEPPAGEPAVLRTAVGVWWRLAAALDTKPDSGAPIDSDALDTILREADEVLAQCQIPEDAAEPLRVSVSRVRAALAKDAVALSQIAATETYRLAIAATAKPAEQLRRVARLTSIRSSPQYARKVTVLWALTLIAAVAAALFHSYRYLKPHHHSAALGSGPVPGMVIAPADGKGTSLVRFAGTPQSLEPALAQLKTYAAANGKWVKQISQRWFALVPRHLPTTPPLSRSK